MSQVDNEKRGKETIEGIELLNKERIQMYGEKENYKHLGILEVDTIKQAEMKEKIKDSLRRRRKFLETKLSAEILSRTIPLVRYFGLFLKWTKEKPRQMGQSTKKLIMMHKTLHLRDDIDRLCV